jgi:hypothetical protein
MELAGAQDQFSERRTVSQPTNIQSHDKNTKSNGRTAPYRLQPWHAGYMAALFENDRNALSGRISHAEQLILSRERELLSQNGDLVRSERNALNTALHALRVLRGIVKPDFEVTGNNLEGSKQILPPRSSSDDLAAARPGTAKREGERRNRPLARLWSRCISGMRQGGHFGFIPWIATTNSVVSGISGEAVGDVYAGV